MDAADKPLLPPPPEPLPEPVVAKVVPDEPLHDVVNDVLVNADPSVAEAVREFIASSAAQTAVDDNPIAPAVESAIAAALVDEPAAMPALVLPPDAAAAADAGADDDAKTTPVLAGQAPEGEPLVAEPAVKAVITESAEPIYVNERRDTTEAEPLQPVVSGEFEATTPVVTAAPTVAAADEARASKSDRHVTDAIAKERGVSPIRVPSNSKAYVAVAAPKRSRAFVAAAMAVAATGAAAAIISIVWARGAVAEAQDSVTPPPQPEPVAKPIEPPTIENTQIAMPVAPAPQTCGITVRASVAEATVWIDGTQQGKGTATLPMTCGAKALVEVRHPRYADFKQDLVVDSELEVDAKLEREKTELTLWSTPEGVEVTYDGRPLGTTPLTVKVDRYEQGHLYFRAHGYEPDWRRINPRDAKKTVSITLKPLR